MAICRSLTGSLTIKTGAICISTTFHVSAVLVILDLPRSIGPRFTCSEVRSSGALRPRELKMMKRKTYGKLSFWDFTGPKIEQTLIPWLSLTYSRKKHIFPDFQGLEREESKFPDFPGFPWPVRTLGTVYGDMHLKDLLGSFVRVGYRIPVPISI